MTVPCDRIHSDWTLSYSRYRKLTQRLLLSGLLALVLSGCGFHLRGQTELSAVLAAPYINGADAEFNSALRDALASTGVTPVSDPANATAIIDLVAINYDRQVLSINSRGVATGYVLTYEVVCRIVDRAGRLLASPARLKLSRTLKYQSTQVLQKREEENILRARMREDLVRQILRRLGSVSRNSAGSAKRLRFS